MRHIQWLIISFLVCCIAWTTILIVQIGKPKLKTLWISEAFEKKEAYANSINQQKIAIVSGSNALFGFDSKLLEEYWQTPVVNTAVTVGFGMEYVLDRSKKSLKKGDIVLMPLEYEFYQEDGSMTEHYVNFLLAHDTEYFYNRSFLDKIIIFSRVDLSWALKGLINYSKPVHTSIKGVYGVHNINQRGDQININAYQMPKEKVKFIESILPDKYNSPELSQHFKITMGNYINWAKQQGICLIILPPNYLYFPEFKTRLFEDLLGNIKTYYKEKQTPYVGNPYDYMLSKDYYYNSRYHLNSLGVERRTQQVMKDIGQSPLDYCL